MFLNLLYPKQCVCCNKILKIDYGCIENKEFACNNCKKKLEYIRRGMPFTMVKNHFFDYMYSSYAYDGFIRKLVLNFKFSNKKYLYDFLSYKLIEDLKHFEAFKIDLILYVPISFKRYLERGYNQSFLIAKKVSIEYNIPILKFCLIKTRNNKRQSELKLHERKENIKGVYRVLFDKLIKDKNILLIDDIYTTGATADECSRVLKMAGAKNILLATIAKAL